MSRASLKTSVVILTLITALIHLVILNISIFQFEGSIDLLFTLNGIGFLVLLAAFLGKIPFISGQDKWIHYSFIGFTLVTILAFFVLGSGGILGYFTKAVEGLLVIALIIHLQKS